MGVRRYTLGVRVTRDYARTKKGKKKLIKRKCVIFVAEASLLSWLRLMALPCHSEANFAAVQLLRMTQMYHDEISFAAVHKCHAVRSILGVEKGHKRHSPQDCTCGTAEQKSCALCNFLVR